jgi:ASC-1-like (ASCH) protein
LEWIKEGKKTIDVRRGKVQSGETAVFQCGFDILRVPIVKREQGSLAEIVREDTYKLIIPSANSLNEAISYLHQLYGTMDGVFTAYYLKTG